MDGGLKALMEDYERQLILHALAEAGGHQRRAARSLGLLPTTLCEKMKRLGLRERSAGPDGNGHENENGGGSPSQRASAPRERATGG